MSTTIPLLLDWGHHVTSCIPLGADMLLRLLNGYILNHGSKRSIPPFFLYIASCQVFGHSYKKSN